MSMRSSLKSLAVIVTLALAMSLVSCNQNAATNPGEDETPHEGLPAPRAPISSDGENIRALRTLDLTADDAPSAAAKLADLAAESGGGRIVFLIEEDATADALTVGSIAGATGGVVLVIEGGTIPPITEAKLVALEPSDVVLVGSASSARDELESGFEVHVVDTGDAIENAAELSRLAFASLATTSFGGTAYIANAASEGDLLGVGPLAAVERASVLVAERDNLPTATREELERLAPTRIVVLGGEDRVSSDVAAELAEVASVERVVAANRWDLAARLAPRDESVEDVILVDGLVVPDVLAATGAAGAGADPLLFLAPDFVPGITDAYLASVMVARVIIAGRVRDAVANEVTRTRTQALSIIPGEVEPIVDYYLPQHSSLVQRSLAVGTIRGCTGTWIGPHTFITAAHCGGSRSVSGTFVARNELYMNKMLEQENSVRFGSTCTQQLATAFAASAADLAIWRCGDAEVPAPGDRFGWVDYDDVWGSGVGASVYAVWFNPVTEHPEYGWIRLYSEGEILDRDSPTWAVPNCTLGVGEKPPYGHESSVWTRPGASGSLQLSPTTHRAVIGPTTSGQVNGPRRWASSMAQMLNHPYGAVPGETYFVETFLDANGVSPAVCDAPSGMQNHAETDADADLVFDVHGQTDAAITSRPIYNLDFNSGWRRELWETGETFVGWAKPHIGGISVPDDAEPWQVHALLSGAGEALRHRLLNLDDTKVYDIRVEYVAEPGDPSGQRITVAFDSSSSTCPFRQDDKSLPAPTRAGSTYAAQTFTLTADGCTSADLVLSVSASSIMLRRVTIAERGASWDFETWDAREPWQQHRHGHAFIYENGDQDPGYFAGNAVSRNIGDLFSITELALTSAPMPPATDLRITFRARAVDASDANLRLRLSSAIDDVDIERQFTVDSDWQTFTADVLTGSAGDYYPRFIVFDEGQIAIDDVVIELSKGVS